MRTQKLIDRLFELLGEMHDDLQEHKCANADAYNQQITELFEQSAAVKQALPKQGKKLAECEKDYEYLKDVLKEIEIKARDY